MDRHLRKRRKTTLCERRKILLNHYGCHCLKKRKNVSASTRKGGEKVAPGKSGLNLGGDPPLKTFLIARSRLSLGKRGDQLLKSRKLQGGKDLIPKEACSGKKSNGDPRKKKRKLKQGLAGKRFRKGKPKSLGAPLLQKRKDDPPRLRK